MDYMFRCPGRVRHTLASLLVMVTVGFGPRAVTAQSDYEVMAVSDGATLSGRVVFHGDVPPARRPLVTKDEEVCGFGYIERTSRTNGNLAARNVTEAAALLVCGDQESSSR